MCVFLLFLVLSVEKKIERIEIQPWDSSAFCKDQPALRGPREHEGLRVRQVDRKDRRDPRASMDPVDLLDPSVLRVSMGRADPKGHRDPRVSWDRGDLRGPEARSLPSNQSPSTSRVSHGTKTIRS